MRESHFARQPRRADRFLGRVTAGRVREEKVFFRVDVVEQGFFRAVGQVHAADGDGDHFSAGGRMRFGHHLKRRVLAGADNQPGAELPVGDAKNVFRHGCCGHFLDSSGRLGKLQCG